MPTPRIDHSHLIYTYLICREDPTHCLLCRDTVTIFHILWVYSALYEKLRNHSHESFIYNIAFHPVLLLGEHPLVAFERMFYFISDTGLLHQL